MACLTEKEFVCNDVDYFERDGGKCALYETQGLVFELAGDTKHPHYVGDNPASDHYTIYKKGESPDSCSSSMYSNLFLVHVFYCFCSIPSLTGRCAPCTFLSQQSHLEN